MKFIWMYITLYAHYPFLVHITFFVRIWVLAFLFFKCWITLPAELDFGKLKKNQVSTKPQRNHMKIVDKLLCVDKTCLKVCFYDKIEPMIHILCEEFM